MAKIKRWFMNGSAVLLPLLACSCATYTPTPTSIQKMGPKEAREAVLEIANPPTYFVPGRATPGALQGATDFEGDLLVADYQVHLLRDSILVLVSGNEFCNIPFTELSPSGQYKFSLTYGCYMVRLKAVTNGPTSGMPAFYSGLVSGGADNPNSPLQDGTQKLVDALSILKATAQKNNDENTNFRLAARAYLAATIKPDFPENARKYRVQAELALKEKRFWDAVDAYQRALNIAQWWPEGHFNLALIFGELKVYDEAISEMKRYLILAPDAADARTSQDKIYEWQGLEGNADSE